MISRRRFLSSSFLVGAPFFASSNIFFLKTSEADDYGETLWEKVKPGKTINFPNDHGSHPSFRLEWWYLTGWLNDMKVPYGFQVTFFRLGTGYRFQENTSFDSSQIVFVHCSISDPNQNRLFVAQKIGRPGIGPVGIKKEDMRLQFEDILFFREEKADKYFLRMNQREFNLNLAITPPGQFGSRFAPVLNGENGFSQKGPNKDYASYYYSRPNLGITGDLSLHQKNPRKVSGIGWLDHEWMSQLLMDDFVGWDWVGINLIDGSSLMVFKIRKQDGSIGWSDYSFIDKSQQKRVIREFNGVFSDQKERHFKNKNEVIWRTRKNWRSPRSGAIYPIEQSIFINKVEYGIIPLMSDQEVDALQSTGNYYWEGAVTMVSGKKEIGVGYLELTGYAAPLSIGS